MATGVGGGGDGPQGGAGEAGEGAPAKKKKRPKQPKEVKGKRPKISKRQGQKKTPRAGGRPLEGWVVKRKPPPPKVYDTPILEGPWNKRGAWWKQTVAIYHNNTPPLPTPPEGDTQEPPATAGAHGGGGAGGGTPIGVFWDLDNLPPSRVDPGGHVEAMRDALGRFGRVVFISAYGNKATLQYVPTQLREQWAEEEEEFEEWEESRQAAKDPSKPFACSFCGNKFQTLDKLNRHLKIHTREQEKRGANLSRKKGKARQRFYENEYLPKQKKIQGAQKESLPAFQRKESDVRDVLKLSGVSVVKVPLQDQAADQELTRDAMFLMAASDGAGKTVCIVSDDSGFKPLIKRFQDRNYRVLIMSSREAMREVGDFGINHNDVFAGDEVDEEDPEFKELVQDEDMLSALGWVDDDKVEEPMVEPEWDMWGDDDDDDVQKPRGSLQVRRRVS